MASQNIVERQLLNLPPGGTLQEPADEGDPHAAQEVAGEDLRDAYKERLVTLGQFIRAQTTHDTVIGHARDVDENGALILQRADGTRARYRSAASAARNRQPG